MKHVFSAALSTNFRNLLARSAVLPDVASTLLGKCDHVSFVCIFCPTTRANFLTRLRYIMNALLFECPVCADARNTRRLPNNQCCVILSTLRLMLHAGCFCRYIVSCYFHGICGIWPFDCTCKHDSNFLPPP